MREVRPRARGLPVMGETCTQYLVLSLEDDMGKPGFEDAKYVFTPPLREKKNQRRCGRRSGRRLQVISTDHCPFRFADQKTLGLENFTKIPNGGPGIENRMQLAYHHGVNAGRISLERSSARRRGARKDLRHVSQKRCIGRWFRCGYCDLGPRSRRIRLPQRPRRCTPTTPSSKALRSGATPPGVLARRTVVQGGRFMGAVGRGRYLHREVAGDDLQRPLMPRGRRR